MGKTIEGYWDCPYCNTKGIRGREQSCPNCGRTRDGNTRFYMKNTDACEDDFFSLRGADWYCDYCGSYNPSAEETCVACGAVKDSKKYRTKEYSEADIPTSGESKEKTWYDESDNDVAENDCFGNEFEEDEVENEHKHKHKQSFLTHINKKVAVTSVAVLSVLLVIISLIAIFVPKTKTITIIEKNWQYDVTVEENKLVEESDWSVPTDAVEVLQQQQEIHHYNHILDHYETVQVQKSRQVLDGYDTYYSYRDNGNGSFEQIEHQTPRYRTEYYNETEQRPVYRDDPVYQTKYYYTIWRWVYNRTETASGTNNEPYWPEYTLADKERVGKEEKSYSLLCLSKNKEKEYECNEEIWNSVNLNESVKVKIVLNKISEIVR